MGGMTMEDSGGGGGLGRNWDRGQYYTPVNILSSVLHFQGYLLIFQVL